MSKKILIIALLAIIFVAQFSSLVFAATYDTTRKASLTVIEYENAYGTDKDSSQNIPLSGVEISLYKLDNENLDKTVEQLETALQNNTLNITPIKLTTGDDGTARFNNLDLGSYFVVQTNSPSNVSVKMESFLVDLPRTDETTGQWNYDITVEPKNITVYGNVLLNKTNRDLSALQGVYWELQVKNSSNEWEKYNYSGSLVTDNDGHIQMSNLPAGKYRFVETGTRLGYILDISNTLEFEISAQNPSVTLNVINEKPAIYHFVKTQDGYGKSLGANITDTIDWKVSADVPNIIQKLDTFYITETINKSFNYVNNSLVVYAGENTLQLNNAYTLEETTTDKGKVLKITFNPQKLAGYDSIYYTFKTTLNSSMPYGEPVSNKAVLTYTNVLDIDANNLSTYNTNLSSAEVHTGALTLKKVDADGNALKGAKFKISRTKEDASNNIYIKDPNDNTKDLVATSGDDGYLTFYGLKFGEDNMYAYNASSKYYITEIESPTYEENGEIKHYQLLADSMEVTVNSNSGNKNDYCTKVVNKKNLTLPVTGAAGSFIIILVGALFLLLAFVRINKNEDQKIEKN